MAEEKKMRFIRSDAGREAMRLIVTQRSRLAVGALLMLINRLLGLAMPASSKDIIDGVILNRQSSLLTLIAFAVGTTTILQAITSFSLLRLLGVAAERTIVEMRKNVQAHVGRLPIRYFDSTQTGI